MQPIIIKRERVRVLEQRVPETAARATNRGACDQSQVNLVTDHGVVHAIEVRCSCGEISVLELEYATPRTDSPAPSQTPSEDSPSQEAE